MEIYLSIKGMSIFKKRKQKTQEVSKQQKIESLWADRNSNQNNPIVREVRTRWYNPPIKKAFSWVEKLVPNGGPFGVDIMKYVKAPLPEDVQEYDENQQIDFCVDFKRKSGGYLPFPDRPPPVRGPEEPDGRGGK